MQQPPPWFTEAVTTPYESHTVEVDGCPIHYLAWGDARKPGLVLVHGGAAHAHWWSFIAPHFVPEYRVAAIDLSGHFVLPDGKGAVILSGMRYWNDEDENGRSVPLEVHVEIEVLASPPRRGRVDLVADGTALVRWLGPGAPVRTGQEVSFQREGSDVGRLVAVSKRGEGGVQLFRIVEGAPRVGDSVR